MIPYHVSNRVINKLRIHRPCTVSSWVSGRVKSVYRMRNVRIRRHKALTLFRQFNAFLDVLLHKIMLFRYFSDLKRHMIQCEIPLKLNQYICYELNKAYIKKENPIFVRRSSEKSMNLKELHENSAAPVILLYVLCRRRSNHKLKAGSMCIIASPQSRLSRKMMKTIQIRG